MKKLMLLLACCFCIGLWGLHAQTKTITGKVTNASDGQPIPGVSVAVSGTTIGTISDMDGMYNLKVPEDSKVLVFSFVGMKSKDVPIERKTRIDVVLESVMMDVDEVVVVGYETRRKSSLTGAVSVVDSKQLADIPAASFDQSLQGQAAGLTVTSSSGRPGKESTVRIRGISSITSGNDPLYIMDGIPITEGDFSSFNPNDIESVTVLKDAASTAIYGSRAANGVIVITTKRGKNQKTQIKYSGLYGVSEITADNGDMMSTTEKLDYEEMLGLKTPGDYDREALEKINNDWVDELFRTGKISSHEISAAGGNDKTKFYISGGFYSEEGIQQRSGIDRYTTRINLDHNASDKFKLGVSLSIGYEENEFTTEAAGNIYNPTFASRLLNPYAQLIDENGDYVQHPEGWNWANPLEQLYLNEDSSNKLKMVGNVYGEYEIIKNLKLKSILGGDFYDYVSHNWVNPNSAWGQETNGSVSKGFARMFRLTNTNLITYSKELGEDHLISFLGGQESIQYQKETFDMRVKTLPNDKIKVPSAAAKADTWGGGKAEYSYLSYFGRVKYEYSGKYIAEAAVRRDGSSRFGVDNRYANFWAVGGSWLIHEEDFFDIPLISNLILRASIGTQGNSDIGNYKSQALSAYGVTYNDGNGMAPASPGNPELSWETSTTFNTTAEIGFLNRINLSLTYYKRKTTDMLYDVPLSLTTGFSTGIDNVAEMENSGIEVEVNADIIDTDFKWNLKGNLGYNTNEITKLYDDRTEILQNASSTIIKVGESFGTFYSTRFAGVNSSNGKSLWYTKDGSITEDYSDDDAVVQKGKSWIPVYSGGFTNTFSYKGVSLSAFFTWMKDKYLLNNTRYFTESNGQNASFGQSKRMLDCWKQPGDVTGVPSPLHGVNNFDDRYIEDASFLRLKLLTLSYNFPKKLLEKTKVFESARIFVQGTNLITWTEYTGYDPEYWGNLELNAYPQVKTFSFGVNVGF